MSKLEDKIDQFCLPPLFYLSQYINDDPIGQLIEGIFECIDQYESEVNGMRTSAAMREAVRQGYFPGSKPPYVFKVAKVEIRPGLFRSTLAVDAHEAAIVRKLFQLYVANAGAKTTAQALNQRKHWYRNSTEWSKDLVLKVLEEPAVAGTYWWGKYDAKTRRKKDRVDWLPLNVEAIIEPELYELARQLRNKREPSRNPGRAANSETLLSGLIRCGKCGSSYTLEGSGKRSKGAVYKYRYYNCRKTCRVGKNACSGGHIATSTLDDAVLTFVAKAVCTVDRCAMLVKREISCNTVPFWNAIVMPGRIWEQAFEVATDQYGFITFADVRRLGADTARLRRWHLSVRVMRYQSRQGSPDSPGSLSTTPQRCAAICAALRRSH